MNQSYCTMAWNSIHYDANGRVAPCCQFRGHEENIYNLTAEEYFASDWLKDIKEKMLAGIKIPGCNRCYKEENQSGSSMRTRRKHLPIDELHEIHLTYSNICNKSCNICRPYRSHLIGREYQRINDQFPDSPWIQEKLSLKQNLRLSKGQLKFDGLNIDMLHSLKPYAHQVKVLHLSGGEPFMHPELNIILDWFIEHGHEDFKISITSNGSWTQAYIDKLKNFKDVEMIISIDGIQDLYPVVRPPHSWEWFDKQEQLLDDTNFKRRYEAVMHIFNVHQLPDLVRYFKDKGIVYLAPLSGQEYLGAHLVPEDVLLQSADELDKLGHSGAATYLKYQNSRTNVPKDVDMFFEFLKVNSAVKGIDYQSVVPWQFDLIQ